VRSFRDLHRDATIVVCGCGESVGTFTPPPGCITIGTNDIGRLFDPDYLVVVNPPAQFRPERWSYVEQSRARAVFSQLDLPLARAPLVRFRLGRFGEAGFEEPDILHYTQNSPYVAVGLALFLGARRIGLIGVDFTDHHFFARTGPHLLMPQLDQIDREYGRLKDACAARGVELLNLSPVSRLSSIPRLEQAAFFSAARRNRRVFFVNYRFLACGDVFTDGLRHAAQDLGLESADAPWDDPDLPARVNDFSPDLLFVVHGRRFVQRWGSCFAGLRSAVWLVDEPYEVDDSSRYARAFTHVFVNDAATAAHHAHGHYLPTCYDPHIHTAAERDPLHDVGFIGGANPTRERLLGALAGRGLLAYVVGGPWRDPRLNAISKGLNIPPAETAALYRATRIVVNVFRDAHHFNSAAVTPQSMNPRIYEALACGALVVSEWRPEIDEVVPELPTFRDEDGLVHQVQRLLADQDLYERTRAACAARLSAHTFANRLRTVMEIALETPPVQLPAQCADWIVCDPVRWQADGDTITLACMGDGAPGSERGLATKVDYSALALTFDVLIPTGACFIAKVHQAAQHDQATNSYHLYCDSRGNSLARHHHVFRKVNLPRDRWVSIRIVRSGDRLAVSADGVAMCHVRDEQLPRGYAVLSVKAGFVKLRNIALAQPPAEAIGRSEPIEAASLHGTPLTPAPRVSIVTTVYDRVDCLRRCIRSVKRLDYRNYEHLIVADSPPPDVVAALTDVVREENDGRLRFWNLAQRYNDWGITPAAVGLRQARGEFVCFLSDDNGYTREHIGALVDALDRDPSIGFAYSSCRYAGRFLLSSPVPAPARIDLGQPLFRRDLFEAHLEDDLPFQVMAWDWALIETFIKRGVQWQHVNNASFIFRLNQYPDLMAASSC